MVRAILVVVLTGGLLATPAAACRQDNPAEEKVLRVYQLSDFVQPEKKPEAGKGNGAAGLLSVLHGQRVQLDKQLTGVTIGDLLADLSIRYEIAFVIRSEAFIEVGVPNFGEMKPTLTFARPADVSVHRFLTLVLRNLDAAYLVREDYIEITPRLVALKEAGFDEAVQEAGLSEDPNALARAEYRLNLPLVCVVVEDKPLDTVITEVARFYDLNVVIHPDARKRLKDIRVNERLLNVPADTALELLVAEVELDLVRKGNTFRIGFGGGV